MVKLGNCVILLLLNQRVTWLSGADDKTPKHEEYGFNGFFYKTVTYYQNRCVCCYQGNMYKAIDCSLVTLVLKMPSVLLV